MSKVTRLGSLLALALIAGTPAVFADDAVSPEPAALSFPGGETFYTTFRPLVGPDYVTVPGSEAVIAYWGEMLADGSIDSYYAVSLDGEHLAGRVRQTDTVIETTYANFDPLVTGEPQMDPSLMARPGSRLRLVQLHAVAIEDMYHAIEAIGGVVRLVQGQGVLVVEIDPGSTGRLAALPFVRWVGDFHPAYRADAAARTEAISGGGGASGEGFTDSSAPHRWSIMVWDRGPEMQSAIAVAVEALGGVVDTIQPDLNRMEATMPAGVLLEVLHLDEVHYVDAWGGPGETDMDSIRNVLGVNSVQHPLLGFDGTGVRAEVFDTELCTTNPEWKYPPIVHSPGTSGSAHGSSCYGVSFAQGLSPSHQGILPNAQGIFFRHTDSSMFTPGGKSRLAIAQESVNPAGIYKSVYQTSSVGSSRTTLYTTLSAEMDTVIFQTDYLHCQSQSNTGNQNSRPQAWSKNILSGGGVDHVNTLTRADDNVSDASTGPASDGRVKPTLVGFYDGVGNTTSLCGYGSFCCTSAATPQVCGTVGIFMQMWHEGVWEDHGGAESVFFSKSHVTTAIAALVNTAYRYPLSQGGLNRYRQAWGTPDVQRLYAMRDKTFLIDEDDYLTPFETATYSIEVASGESDLNVTLCYIDVAGSPSNSSQHRVNDLSLRVTSPDGTKKYWGNAGLKSGNVSTTGGSSDTKDTLENVFVPSPAAGVWTVEVIADEVVADTGRSTGAMDAAFSLWITGGVESAPCEAECDGEPGLDLFDVLCYLNAFNAGQESAECDGNPGLDIFDILCFLNKFNADCS